MVKNNANNRHVIVCAVLVFFTTMCVPLKSIGQDSCRALTDFLHYFTQEYLWGEHIYKINDKVRSTTFSKQNKHLVFGLSINLKNDHDFVSLTATEKNQLISHLLADAPVLKFTKHVPDSFLVSIDSLYLYDSLFREHGSAFKKKYGRYLPLLNQQKFNELPDSVFRFYQENKKLEHLYFTAAYQFASNMVEISTPYFFDHYSKCVVMYVGHLNDASKARVLLFQKKDDKWALKKILFDKKYLWGDEP